MEGEPGTQAPDPVWRCGLRSSFDAMGGDARHATLFAANKVGARHPSRVLSRVLGGGLERGAIFCHCSGTRPSTRRKALIPNNAKGGSVGERDGRIKPKGR